jgi:hypothetical protein
MSFGSSFGDLGNQFKESFDSLNNEFQSKINSAQKATIKGGSSAPLPWFNVKSRFFSQIDIDPSRWDQLYPYRLIVIDTSKGNRIVGGSTNTQISVRKDQGRTAIDFTALDTQWVFTLPITPQQLNIADQFAINTSATLLGVLEEHSGVKFKMINAQGTMGVWPYRESVVAPPASPNTIQSIFGGTIEAASSALGQVARTINAATSNHPASKPISKPPSTSIAGQTSTGFYMAQALEQFLEQYAEAKKDPANKGWRLVFDIPKQNQSLICTPISFIWQQNVQKPLEVNYTFQLKAWRRIDLKQKPAEVLGNGVQKLTPGILQRVLNTISEARKVLSSLTNLIGAVRSDVLRPLEVLRQTTLFLKDLAGVVLTAADLPFQLQRDFKYAINDFFKNIGIAAVLRNAASDPTVAQALKDFKVGWNRSEGISSAGVATGQLGAGATQAQSIDPGMAVLDKPEKSHSLIDQAPVHQLVLNQAQQDAVESAVDDARLITIDDLKGFRSVMQELALQLSNNFGAGDSYYSQVYSRATPTARIQPMTLDEYDILKQIYDIMQAYDILTATTDIDDQKKQSNMDYVASLASAVDIPFQTTDAKTLAPVPYGMSIEGIALRYLGDAQRWIEIATLNNLRSPYIDENGFKLSLLSNATGRQITVGSAENLYVGQRVIIGSSTQQQTARRILGLDRLSSTSYLITLDGEQNLDVYITTDGAYMQAYLPGTVNSQQKIFIPSDLPVSSDPNILPPVSTASDPLTSLSKVDWLITEAGDLATNSFGDFRLSAGITNLIQALRIKLSTQKGKLLTHPEFGLGIKVGMMSSDVDVQEIFSSIDKLIKEDQRFDGLASLQVILNGPTLTINMGVNIANVQGVFPVSFDLAAA